MPSFSLLLIRCESFTSTMFCLLSYVELILPKSVVSFHFFCLVLTDSSCNVCTLLGVRSAYSMFLLLAMFFLRSSYPTSAGTCGLLLLYAIVADTYANMLIITEC